MRREANNCGLRDGEDGNFGTPAAPGGVGPAAPGGIGPAGPSPDGSGGTGTPAAAIAPDWKTLSGNTSAYGTAATTPVPAPKGRDESSTRRRYEFVVMFVWREPAPPPPPPAAAPSQ